MTYFGAHSEKYQDDSPIREVVFNPELREVFAKIDGNPEIANAIAQYLKQTQGDAEKGLLCLLLLSTPQDAALRRQLLVTLDCINSIQTELDLKTLIELYKIGISNEDAIEVKEYAFRVIASGNVFELIEQLTRAAISPQDFSFDDRAIILRFMRDLPEIFKDVEKEGEPLEKHRQEVAAIEALVRAHINTILEEEPLLRSPAIHFKDTGILELERPQTPLGDSQQDHSRRN